MGSEISKNIKKYKGILLTLIMSLGCSLSAISLHVTGMVKDSLNQSPVAGATIIAFLNDSMVAGAISDYDGIFNLDIDKKGSYQIKVSYLGYGEEEYTVHVSEDLKSLNFQLIPSAINISPISIIVPSEQDRRAIHKIDAKQVSLISAIGTQGLLEKIPGINGFADDGIGNSRINIGIRGLSPRRSQRTLILEDGIPIQPAIYTYSNAYYNPPAERIKEIEVIKGTGAIQYGPLTMGGVVNYITSKPRTQYGGTSKITIGNNNYMSLFSEVGGWGKKSWKPELQFLYKRGDGFRDHNAFEQYNSTLKFRKFSKDNKHSHYIKLNGNFENSNATYTGLTEYSFHSNPNFNPKKHDQFNVFRVAADYIHLHHKSKTQTISDKVYANYFNREWWRENDIFVTAQNYEEGNIEPIDFLSNEDLVRVGDGKSSLGILRTFYVAGYERNWNISHNILHQKSTSIIGVRTHYESFLNQIQKGNQPDSRSGSFISLDPVTLDTLFKGTREQFQAGALSLFIDEKISINKWNISLGVRSENYYQTITPLLGNDPTQARLTTVLLPGASVNYPIGKINTHMSIHRGFTPASRSNLLVISTDPNQKAVTLTPETSWNMELGAVRHHKYVQSSITLFHLLIDDMVSLARGTTVSNIGKVQSYGAEAGVYILSSKWGAYLPDVRVNYTYNRTNVVSGAIEQSAIINGPVDISGKELPYAPHHNLSLSLEKYFANWAIWVNYKYVSQSFSDVENIPYTFNRGDTGPIPAYWLYNASVSYTYKKNWAFQLAGKNLFDHIYIGSRLHSNPAQRSASVSSGILPGARRQLNFSCTYHF